MPASAARRLVWLLAAAILAVAVLAALIPWLASTQIVRNRIALEMSVWSGYKVELGSTPDIEIWPVFRATMNNVRLLEWDGDPEPVVDAERVEADLSALAALRGDVVFTRLRLIRPSARLSRDGFNVTMPPSDGRLSQAIEQARGLLRADTQSAAEHRLPDDALGSLEIVDGRLSIGERGSETEVLTGFAGRLDWPALDRPATGKFTGIWRGEMVGIELDSSKPLLLLAGGNAPTNLRLKSAPLEFSFAGTASFRQDVFLDGEMHLTAASLRRMLQWTRSEMAGSASAGALSLDSHVSGGPERFKLADAIVSLDGNPGRGTLELALGPDRPSVAGTLAFETVDLSALVAAFLNVTPENWASYGAIESDLSRRLSTDLRLSATRAAFGPLTLADVAATMQVRDGLAAFDISDATAFGGAVQAGIRIDGPPGESRVELRLRADEIDMGMLASGMKATNLVPIARGGISMTLKGDGRNWYDVARTASGNLTAQFGPGALAGLDVPALISRSSKGEFFPLQEVSDGTVRFKAMDVKVSLERGVASVERLHIDGEQSLIGLEGLIPLAGRGLAMQGRIEDVTSSQEPNTARGTAFFIGGSWDAPYISPIVPFEMRP